MKGFNSLDVQITAPDSDQRLTLHQWFLTIKTADISKCLISSIDVDQNNVYYFCCNRTNRNAIILWLDNLPDLLRSLFTHDDLYLIQDSDNNNPSRSYRTKSAENTRDAICGFAHVLNNVLDKIDDIVLPDGAEVEEDHLSNCWTAPLQSVYSRHSLEKCAKTSSTTQASTVSTVTDSNSLAGKDQPTGETAAFLYKAPKQLDDWETAAKARAKEQE
eukprot:4092426-Ditylum_brightwellii.AAC.1